LVFIVMFGVVLTELTGTNSSEPARIVDEPSALNWTPTIEDISPAVAPAPRTLAQADTTGASEATEAAAGTVALASADSAGSKVGSPPGEAANPPIVSSWQAPSSASNPAEAARATGAIRYTVQPNDSLIKIARSYYGTGNEKLYRRILQANRDVVKDESVLLVGQVLRIPPVDGAVAAAGQALAGTTPSPTPKRMAGTRRILLQAETAQRPSGRVYVVRRGDNLTKIARRTLHDDSRSAAMKIFNANRDKLKNPDHLTVGLKLEIPI